MLPLLIHNFLMPILHLFRMQISLYISSSVICSAKLYMTDQKLSQVCKSEAEGEKKSLRKGSDEIISLHFCTGGVLDADRFAGLTSG